LFWGNDLPRWPALAAGFAILLAPLVSKDPAAAAPPVRFDFEQRYFMDPGRIVSDHTLVLIGEEYHLFYGVGYQGEGWMLPGNMVDFGHATSTDLIHWDVEPPVLSIIPDTWRNRNLWAPHVIRRPSGQYFMYYAGVDSAIVQQIGLATSHNLYTWADAVPDSVYHPDPVWAAWQPGQWSNGRDPWVGFVDNVLVMLTTASTRPGYLGMGSRGAVSLAVSPDGRNWSDMGAPLFINDSYLVLESTHLLRHGALYYLFYHEQNVPGVSYMTSTSPFSGFNKVTAQTLEGDSFAPEIVPTARGTYFTRIRDAMWDEQSILGVKFDPLTWKGAEPALEHGNLMYDDWTTVWGNAFALQPTFGDRPEDRTGFVSNIEGLFAINTSEQHAGPLGWGCPECPPEPAMTGVLRSRVFRLTHPTLTLRIGGGSDPDSTYVALYNAINDEEIARGAGRGNDFLYPQAWDVTPHLLDWVYLEIGDLARTGAYGYVSVDLIEESEGPPVASAGEIPDLAVPALRVAVAPSPGVGPFRFQWELAQPGRLTLRVHNVLGRCLTALVLGDFPEGRGQARWEARDAGGAPLPAGTYFYRLSDERGRGAEGKLVLVP
jgi:hypothetical protein